MALVPSPATGQATPAAGYPPYANGAQAVLDIVFGGSPPPRTLITASLNGLANRLKVLLSGRTLAADSQRTFAMLWPRTAACGASFAELFQDDLRVTAAPEDLVALPCFETAGRPTHPLRHVGQDLPAHIMVRGGHWLSGPQGRAAANSLHLRWAQMLGSLQPVPAVAARSEDCRRQFRPAMIGVHLRRGDFMQFWPHTSQSVPSAFLAVEHFLSISPAEGTFLCTDDGAIDPKTGQPTPVEGIRAAFQARYGDRVVGCTPRSLERSTPAAIQDALSDLLLLRTTDYFVGTLSSSFSTLAALGRSVPKVISPAATPQEVRAGATVRALGLGRVVCGLARLRWGYELPFPLAWNWLVRLRHKPARYIHDFVDRWQK